MSVLIDCPSCQRQLRVPKEFLGKNVRCPSCSATFRAPEAVAESPRPPVPEAAPVPAPAPAGPEPLLTVPLRLELDDGPVTSRPAASAPPAEPPPPPARRREPEPDYDDDWDERPRRRRRRDFDPCPRCREDVRRGAVVCPYCGLDLEEQGDGTTRQRRVRLDAEPHRGSTVYGLGVASLVVTVLWFLFPIGIPLGIVAWVMGHRDLRKMEEGVMDPAGRKKTRDGRTCGIIGACINGLFGLGGVLVVVLMLVINEAAPAPVKRPIPPMPAAKPPPWKAAVPPAPPPRLNNFTLIGPADAVVLERGVNRAITLTLERVGNFRGDVTLIVDEKPKGIRVELAATVLRGFNNTTLVTLVAADNALAGDGIVRIRATSNQGDEVLLDVRVRVGR